MIEKKYGDDFVSYGGALTIEPDYLGGNISGWSIEGKVICDYYEWVNEFQAIHPVYGRVWGDFESIVYADSEEGFANFMENHPPHAWDYMDI